MNTRRWRIVFGILIVVNIIVIGASLYTSRQLKYRYPTPSTPLTTNTASKSEGSHFLMANGGIQTVREQTEFTTVQVAGVIDAIEEIDAELFLTVRIVDRNQNSKSITLALGSNDVKMGFGITSRQEGRVATRWKTKAVSEIMDAIETGQSIEADIITSYASGFRCQTDECQAQYNLAIKHAEHNEALAGYGVGEQGTLNMDDGLTVGPVNMLRTL